jgi:hypothetical protein
MDAMDDSQAPWVIRNCLGEFFQQLAFVDRHWIRVNSCANNWFLPKGKQEPIKCPIDPFCDLLGVSAKRANDYLCAIKLLTPNKRYKNSIFYQPKSLGRTKK